LTALVCSLASATSSAPDGEQWIADFDVAAAKARAENKDLLVDFTGSDWCGWCIRLGEEVFAHQAFLDAAQKKYVLVALDFPRGEEALAKVPNFERNQALSEKHSVRGFPTILLMTASGVAFARTGYQEGGPVPYVAHLDEIAAKGKQELTEAQDLVAKFAAAEDKVGAWNQIAERYEALGPEVEACRLFLPPIKAAFELDPQNEQGLKRRAVDLLMDAGEVDKAVCQAVRDLDPKNEDGLLEKAVMAECGAIASQEEIPGVCKTVEEFLALGKIHDPELKVYLLANLAHWTFTYLEDGEKAKKFAKQAMEAAPENERLVEAMNQIINS
jgi:thioredoxin-related protein